jgi:hypothetical protein
MPSYLTAEPITCEIRNASGAVTVDLTDTSMTTVEIITTDDQPGGFLDDMIRTVSGWGNRPEPAPGLGDDATEDVVVEFQNNKLIVDSEPARRRWHTGFIVRITAPSGSGIRARTESAAVAITGTADRLEVKTASGSVNVESSIGNAMVRTVSGDVEVRDVSRGTVDLAAVSGSLSIGVHAGVAARVDLTTVSGRAHTDLPLVGPIAGSELTIKGRTVSGDISLGSALVNAG